MHRSTLVVGLAGAMSLAGVVVAKDASACGGCFRPPAQTDTDITDERMLLSVSPTQTTLYDQIQYSGNPSSFAWVLPIHGTVSVGLSADVLFASVDTLTATTILQPLSDCPAPACASGHGQTTGPGECAGGACGTPNNNGGGGGVVVTKQQNVGPYATVQLKSTSPTALDAWLTTNGFDIPADVQTILAAYVAEGFDFLAMKLLPGQGVQAMRPVRVSMPGASLSLPLRMAAIGTGATVGITIWVVSDGRYIPQNFPFFHIEDSELVWDWATGSSNYTTLRSQHEAAFNGKGWELESSLSIAQQTLSGVIQSGGVYYGNAGGGGAVNVPPPADASQDYLPGTAADGTMETAEQVRADDITALFAGMSPPNVRITRMRSDISHASMTTDFVLAAAMDQSELSNVRNVTQQVNVQCPIYGGSDCTLIGYGSPGQAQSAMDQSPPGGSPRGGSFACNATPAEPFGGQVGLGAAVAMIGLAVTRARRRRG
jgi:hypothetical protein